MAIARSKLVDVSVARWYHCVSRCVRKAFLLGEGDGNRKWLENRLEELGEISRAGRIYGPPLSPGKSLDLGGAGRDLRAAGFERPALAARDGKAPRRSFGGPLLRGQPRETAGNRRPDRRAAPGQPDGLSDPMTRS